jgi:hypothetical protein
MDNRPHANETSLWPKYSNMLTGITCLNYEVKKEICLNFHSLVNIFSEFLVGKVHSESSTRMVLKTYKFIEFDCVSR